MILGQNWPDIVKTWLFKYFNDEYRTIQMYNSILFNIQKSEIYQEVMSSAGEYPDLDNFDGNVDYNDMYEGYEKTFKHVEKAGGLQIRDTLLKDAKGAGHGFVFGERPMAMARATARTREKDGAAIFNDAFTSEPTDGDGVELCGDDHPNNNPEDSGTQTNEGTDTFGPTAVETTRRAMAKFKDDQGDFTGSEMDMLAFPENQWVRAWELGNSTGKMDVSTNNKNFHFGRYKLLRYRRLQNQNNWFAIDTVLMKRMLYWFNRENITFLKDMSSDTFSAKFIAYYRKSLGWRNWPFIFGNLVS